jgi:hypothetical protein
MQTDALAKKVERTASFSSLRQSSSRSASQANTAVPPTAISAANQLPPVSEGAADAPPASSGVGDGRSAVSSALSAVRASRAARQGGAATDEVRRRDLAAGKPA